MSPCVPMVHFGAVAVASADNAASIGREVDHAASQQVRPWYSIPATGLAKVPVLPLVKSDSIAPRMALASSLPSWVTRIHPPIFAFSSRGSGAPPIHVSAAISLRLQVCVSGFIVDPWASAYSAASSRPVAKQGLLNASHFPDLH